MKLKYIQRGPRPPIESEKNLHSDDLLGRMIGFRDFTIPQKLAAHFGGITALYLSAIKKEAKIFTEKKASDEVEREIEASDRPLSEIEKIEKRIEALTEVQNITCEWFQFETEKVAEKCGILIEEAKEAEDILAEYEVLEIYCSPATEEIWYRIDEQELLKYHSSL